MGPRSKTLVVTRHAALIEYLRELGLIDADARVVSHATPEEVQGRDVIGVLPLHLASLANTVTEVEIVVPQELRGRELTLDDIRTFARGIRRYRVARIDADLPGVDQGRR